MSHEIVWRRRPEDPVAAWRWVFRFPLRWSLPPRREWKTRLIGPFFVSLSYVVYNILFGKFSPFDLLFLAIPISTFFMVRRPDAVAHGALPTLVDASTFELFPVAMTVRSRARTTGEERGWLSVTEGWLVIEGLRATVSLQPDSVSGVFFEKDATRLRLADGRELSLRLLQQAHETTLPAPIGKKGLLNDTLRQWHRGLRPEGEPVLPPRTLHPEVAARRIQLWFATTLLGAMVTVAGMILGSPAQALPVAVITSSLLMVSLVQMQRFHDALPEIMD